MNTLFYLPLAVSVLSVLCWAVCLQKERDEGTVAACITGVFQGVDMVRVHNVKMHKRALAVADGLLRGE